VTHVNRSHEKPLKAVIEEFLKSFRLEDKLAEARILHSWEKVVGQMVARHTVRINIRHKVLYVKLDSAALRNELMFARGKIVTALNKEAGMLVIEEIVLN